jgi:tetratricopeptide (TPR) repeat protein
MTAFIRRFVGCMLALVLTPVAIAAGGPPNIPPGQAPDPDYVGAEAAIKDRNWDGAVEALNRMLVRRPDSADAYNLLGYSERHRGNLDAAFRHYDKALALNPGHRGAHEYVGEAYLMVDNLAKAEEHLKRLDRLCFFGCEEYDDLKAKVAEYKAKNNPQAASVK